MDYRNIQCTPVSYTHLDVYKRQGLYLIDHVDQELLIGFGHQRDERDSN